MDATFMFWSKIYWAFWFVLSVFVAVDLFMLGGRLRDKLFSYNIMFKYLFLLFGVIYLIGLCCMSWFICFIYLSY
jgi:hypothetical protein